MSSVVIVVLGVAAAAAVADVRTGRIPNELTLPLLAVAGGWHLLREGSMGLLTSIIGTIASSVVPLFLFYRGAMGGGDVKLFAALGAALGATLGLEIQIVAYVSAALYAIAMLVLRRAQKTVRLGAFILLGCVYVVGKGWLRVP